MPIQLYNTLTREKAPFTPLDPGNVRVYVCGPTVYDFAHIGNARPVVVFDVFFRLLRHVYGPEHVTYARNITDVDDKIINAARESGEPIDSITTRTTEAFHEDMTALGALEPTVEPRATRHIPQMIALIEALIARGHAYPADGHVLFSVPSMPAYGRLSRRGREDMIAGARVEVAPYKKDPADFVLWKPSTPEQPGWDSPWGRGRPGWHIECSAMSAEHLGADFDVHGGGQDLIFPHHENEIAQSTCGTDGRFARVWMHNGYVVVEGEKMSKSLGNFFTVRQLLEEGWPGEAIRLTLLSAHYRQPLDFTREKLKEAKSQLDRWYRALELCGEVEPESPPNDEPGIDRFLSALEDDLNTPKAIAELNQQVNLIFHSQSLSPDTKRDIDFGAFKGRLRFMSDMLGVLDKDPENWRKKGRVIYEDIHLDLRAGITAEGKLAPDEGQRKITVPSEELKTTGYPPTVRVGPSEDEINRLIEKRAAARKAKDFATADRIRDELKAQGIILEDHPDRPTDWRRD